jgi:hypothetical protein
MTARSPVLVSSLSQRTGKQKVVLSAKFDDDDQRRMLILGVFFLKKIRFCSSKI